MVDLSASVSVTIIGAEVYLPGQRRRTRPSRL